MKFLAGTVISLDATYIIAAFISLLGSSGLATFLAQRNARRADASQTRLLVNQKEVSEAAKAASDAAIKLIETARGTDERLAQLQVTANNTKTVADNTHAIVNSDRTKMMQALAVALESIAALMPENLAAKEAARAARAQADRAQSAQDALGPS